jgi:hypothetical protein
VDGRPRGVSTVGSIGGGASRDAIGQRVRLHEDQRRAPVAPDSHQGKPKQSIATFEARAVRGAFHRRQLLPKRQVLQDQLPMAAERQRQCAGDDDQ